MTNFIVFVCVGTIVAGVCSGIYAYCEWKASRLGSVSV